MRQQRARERPGAGGEAAGRLVAHGDGQRLLDLGLARPRRLQHEHADVLAEAERLEPPREVGPGQLAATQRGQQVAGEPALGVVGDAAAQQLERDDRHGLVEREAVELGQRAGVLGRHEPRVRQSAGAAVPFGGVRTTGSASARPSSSPPGP